MSRKSQTQTKTCHTTLVAQRLQTKVSRSNSDRRSFAAAKSSSGRGPIISMAVHLCLYHGSKGLTTMGNDLSTMVNDDQQPRSMMNDRVDLQWCSSKPILVPCWKLKVELPSPETGYQAPYGRAFSFPKFPLLSFVLPNCI